MIYSYATGNAGSVDTVPLFSLTPNTAVTFPQGLGALSKGTGQGNRIGNEVEFTKGTLRMMLSCNPYDAVSNPNPQPIIAKNMPNISVSLLLVVLLHLNFTNITLIMITRLIQLLI